MAEETLEQRIEERKKQAKGRKIEDKAGIVARYLGRLTHEETGYFQSDEVQSYTCTHEFQNDDFHIKDTGYTRIVFQSELVFEGGYGEIDKYIPGAWEKKLNGLYGLACRRAKEAEAKEQADRNKEKQKKATKLKKKWGL